MHRYDLWDKDRGMTLEEIGAANEERRARRVLLHERTIAMLEQCKGLSMAEIQTVTNAVIAEASVKAFLSE